MSVKFKLIDQMSKVKLNFSFKFKATKCSSKHILLLIIPEPGIFLSRCYLFVTCMRLMIRELFPFTAEGGASPLDPPEHLFRIRLVCVLLETCGTYFDKGSSKKKLDCFLAYFQVCSPFSLYCFVSCMIICLHVDGFCDGL